MLIQAITQTQFGPVYTLNGNDDLNVASGVVLTSLSADGILASSGVHVVTVSGVVMAKDDGIDLAGVTGPQSVTIQAGGVLIAGYDNSIEDADGVVLEGAGSSLTNFGSILAHGSGVSVIVSPSVTTTITNAGFISADKYGIWNKSASGTLSFTNSGTIESPLAAYFGGAGIDLVTNSGTMIGDVFLKGGHDVYNGVTGTVIGTVYGGEGDDLFLLGAAPDAVDGGGGVDTLDLQALTLSTVIDLANSANNAGAALSEVFIGIENILGGARADDLRGDASDNQFFGFNGSDRLDGGAGQDLLVGGTGQDQLTGGAGADCFAFTAMADLRDAITDFAHGEDVIRFDALSFKLGALSGPLSDAMFQSGTSNLASESDDRFIFNQTDTTLWYDRDGSGTKYLATLVVDLQAGAVLSASDILLI